MPDVPEAEEVINTAKESLRLLKKHLGGKPFIEPVEEKCVLFIGDTHGYTAATKLALGRYANHLLVFLGDYVDRGNEGLENLMLILNRMIDRPNHTIVLRGNHESKLVNRRYGFLDEVSAKIGLLHYAEIEKVFASLPYAAVVNNNFCVHGGIARKTSSIEDVASLPTPDLLPSNPTAYELLWNDPSEIVTGFAPNINRGPGSYFYGTDATAMFLKSNNLNHIIRGHEVADGFNESMNGKIITIFSSFYHGAHAGLLELKDGFSKKILL